jgi:hypothetical protein
LLVPFLFRLSLREDDIDGPAPEVFGAEALDMPLISLSTQS